MGDDRKLVDDIVSVAKELHPGFIAVAGTPHPHGHRHRLRGRGRHD